MSVNPILQHQVHERRMGMFYGLAFLVAAFVLVVLIGVALD